MSQFAQYQSELIGNVKGAIRSPAAFVANQQDIREICARLLLAHEGEEFQAAFTELKIAIYEQVMDADNRRTEMTLKMPKNGRGG